MKCLEKDRTRRYETANGLASDIQRHLGNEPVVACPPSATYRLRKMVKRNKAAFAASAGVAAALIIGLAFALWQSIEKTRAYNRALTAEAAAQSEAQILKDMIASAGPEVARGRDATIILEMLDKTAKRVGTELTTYPAVECDLSFTIGELYRDLGHPEKAEQFLRRAFTLREQNPRAVRKLEILWSMWAVMLDQGKFTEAEEYERKALPACRKFGRDDTNAFGFLAGAAQQLSRAGKAAEAKPLATEALTLSRKFFGDTDERVALALHKLAGVEDALKEFQDAEAHRREAIGIVEKLGGHEYELQIYRANLLQTLTHARKWQEAQPLRDESLAFARKFYKNDHPNTAIILETIGMSLVDEQGRLPEAEKVLREALEIRQKRFGNEHPDVAKSRFHLGVALIRQGKLGDAIREFSEIIEIFRKHPEWSFENRDIVYNALGKALADQGDLVQAEAVQSEHLDLLRKRASKNKDICDALAELAITLMAEQKFAQAEPLTRDCMAFCEEISPDHWSAFSAKILRGECLLSLKRFSEAEPLLIAGYQGIKQKGPLRETAFFWRRRPRERKALELLVRLHQETGHPERAAEWQAKLTAFDRKNTDDAHQAAEGAKLQPSK
jgi:tetratricopeptide (TPR) repeat protein